MKKIFVFLISIVTFSNVNSQYKAIIFIDSLSKLPVEDVYVQKYYNGIIDIIGISNKNGIYKLKGKEDTFKLFSSHISYYKKEILLKAFGLDTVYLVARTNFLSEILVQNFKTNKSSIIGYYNTGRKQNLYAPTPKSIIGTKISIDTAIKKFKIQGIYCDFEKLNLVENRKSDCKIGVIFHFLKFYNNSPSFEEVIEPIVIDYNRLNQKFKLELPSSNIIDNSSGAIFIGIELQGIECNNQSVNYKSYYLINKESTDNLNWIYNFKQNRWKQYNNSLFSGKLGLSIKISYHE